MRVGGNPIRRQWHHSPCRVFLVEPLPGQIQSQQGVSGEAFGALVCTLARPLTIREKKYAQDGV